MNIPAENISKDGILLESSSVRCFRIPTEEPQSDGTLRWDHTSMVVVTLRAGGESSVGYTYADQTAAYFIKEHLFPLIENQNILQNTKLWDRMVRQIRNLGRPGVASMAIAAVDNSLWDLKAKCLHLPLCVLLGQLREDIPVYASGGFTSYDPSELSEKFQQMKEEGHRLFKMKIGRNKAEDIKRLRAARDAIEDAELFVDANGAYYPREAIAMGEILKEYKVIWYEEPVTSDNLPGMKLIRGRVPAMINVTADEYGYDLTYFHRMLSSEAVDVLQADATRCAGITGLMKAHTLCEAFHLPFSAHCAPSIHLHPAVSLKNMVHVEYFRDHVRIEKMFFDGYAEAKEGKIHPDLSRNGIGLEIKSGDLDKYEIFI